VAAGRGVMQGGRVAAALIADVTPASIWPCCRQEGGGTFKLGQHRIVVLFNPVDCRL